MMTRLPSRVKSRLQLTLRHRTVQIDLPAQSAMRFVLFVVIVVCLLLRGAPLIAQTQLLVYAASSLTDAFLALEADFEREHPGIDLLFNFTASSTLAAQLLLGAPADVFASADERQMEAVYAAGLTRSARTFARNSLALALPADNPAGLATAGELAQPGVRLVLAAPGVPVRGYTEQVLARLARLAILHDFSLAAVLENVVSEESNVRQVLFKLAHGSADAGFVYYSDITAELDDRIMTLHIPAAANVRARYPVAVLQDSSVPQLAQDFVDYLLSPAGQQSLQRSGFDPAQPELPQLSWLTCGTGRP